MQIERSDTIVIEEFNRIRTHANEPEGKKN